MQLQSTNNMRPRVNNNNNNNNEFDMFFNMMQRMEYQHQNKLKDLRKQINALKAQKFVTEASKILISNVTYIFLNFQLLYISSNV